MDPFIGSALIGAGSNLLSNLFNRGSTSSTNKTNLKIAQMNNEWSERMMQKQMDYNTQMWNKTNEYNTASAQRKRLEDAGLNPSLMMNGGSAGIASAASSPSLPSPASAVMQPNRYDFSGIGESVSNAYRLANETKVADEQARFLGNQADWYSAKAMADIAQAFSNVRNKDLQSKGLEIQNRWADSMLGAQYISQIRQNQSMEVSILNSIKQGFLLDKDIASYDARLNGDLSEQLSRISLSYAQGKLSLQQADKALQETWTELERRIGVKIDNDVKAHTRDSVIERAKQPQNMYQMAHDVGKQVRSDYDYISSGAKRWFDKNIVKPSKRAWKDTRRAFGLYGY